MNTTDTEPSTLHNDANSLDIDDPDLIKFMNTKMSVKSLSLSDIFLDLVNFAFDNIIVKPYNNIYDYITSNIDFNNLFPQDFIDNFRPTVLNELLNDENTLETEVETGVDSGVDSGVESDHVLVENNRNIL